MVVPRSSPPPNSGRRPPPNSGRRSPPSVDDLTGKIEVMSIRTAGKPQTPTQSPASSSPSSDLIVRRGEIERYHPPTPHSGRSRWSEEEGSSGMSIRTAGELQTPTQSSASSSSSSDLVVRRGEIERYHPPTPHSGGSRWSEEDGSSGMSIRTAGELQTPTQSPASSSPSSDLVARCGEIERNHPPTSHSGESRRSEEKGSSGMSRVRRKKDFQLFERVGGRRINVLQGLELHTGVFSDTEQKRIVDYVYELQEMGRRGSFRERTYSEPRKWMRGKGRVTIQLGCCYNYATDKNGNPPGIIRDEEVDPIPPLLKTMIRRMVEWQVLLPTCIPNSCIINIYDKDDCIPPHIDHHDFLRPFCTVSFLSECSILFGTELKVLGPGDFFGSFAIPLPLGSVLILSGNGADVAKHCVPAVPSKRISITFRKMDDTKLPFKFRPDPELHNLRPLTHPGSTSAVVQVRTQASPVQEQGNGIHSRQGQNPRNQKDPANVEKAKSAGSFHLGLQDFPPLGSSSGNGRASKPARPIRQ